MNLVYNIHLGIVKHTFKFGQILLMVGLLGFMISLLLNANSSLEVYIQETGNWLFFSVMTMYVQVIGAVLNNPKNGLYPKQGPENKVK